MAKSEFKVYYKIWESDLNVELDSFIVSLTGIDTDKVLQVMQNQPNDIEEMPEKVETFLSAIRDGLFNSKVVQFPDILGRKTN